MKDLAVISGGKVGIKGALELALKISNATPRDLYGELHWIDAHPLGIITWGEHEVPLMTPAGGALVRFIKLVLRNRPAEEEADENLCCWWWKYALDTSDAYLAKECIKEQLLNMMTCMVEDKNLTMQDIAWIVQQVLNKLAE